ncbi:MAG: capsular polysaccharide biosynthesis protein [Desulfovibrionaceae bacterium]|nr:capsular polysaccharide biosynthesis protein [Desulfovibrionaceae bacterium]
MRYLFYFARRIAAHIPSLPAPCAALFTFARALFCERPRTWVASFAYGMRSLPFLERYLGAQIFFLPRGIVAHCALKLLPGCTAVALWGAKEELPAKSLASLLRDMSFVRAFFVWIAQRRLAATRRFALAFAKAYNLPLIRLEDGFLRSVDLGVNGGVPHSLILDRIGIYYDARSPSGLETLLNSNWTINDVPCAQSALNFLLDHKLSKYNHTDGAPERLSAKKNILVLDQTFGDVSIRLGLADDSVFRTMLHDAIAENPDATIWVKLHPDVLSGKKKGHFTELPEGVQTIAQDANPIALLRTVDAVYTVTSQMGFEALLLGLPVHCYGLPFYAGWGCTIDKQVCPRRVRQRSVLELFWAAYALYPRYIDPVSGEETTLEETMRALVYERACNMANAGAHACLFFTHWKKPHARAFLSGTKSQVTFFSSIGRAVAHAQTTGGNVVVWSSKADHTVDAACAAAHVPLMRMEDGFIRSLGLGSNFMDPGSLVLDDLGIYYDPSRESRLERILLEDRSEVELAQALALQDELVRSGISKYNVSGKSDLPKLPKNQRILLVPGQVEDDASVRFGGMGIYTNADLLTTVRAENPDAYILYKEHPDVVSGNRVGALTGDAIRSADAIIRTAPIEQVLANADEVHTLTSLTGFEALLRGKPVATYGGPFYAGWGLTRDRNTFPRRTKRLTLAHLVYGALIAYPRYYSYKRHMLVHCLAFVRALAKERAKR